MKSVFGRKVGMTQIFDDTGVLVPVSVIQCEPMTVVQKKTVESHGYNAIQVGFGEVKERRVNKPTKGHFDKAGVDYNLNQAREENAILFLAAMDSRYKSIRTITENTSQCVLRYEYYNMQELTHTLTEMTSKYGYPFEFSQDGAKDIYEDYNIALLKFFELDKNNLGDEKFTEINLCLKDLNEVMNQKILHNKRFLAIFNSELEFKGDLVEMSEKLDYLNRLLEE